MKAFARIGLLALVCVAGCAHEFNQMARDDLSRRASFDLSCPQDKLETTVLKEMWNGRETQLGVRGCGKQASYVLNPNDQWIKE